MLSKTQIPETPQTTSLSGMIVEIDDHGNAVTDLYVAPFTERGWKLGDTLEATFATGQKIQIKFVENYGDVPEGDYLGRFSTSTKQFKIAINMGNIAEALKLKNQSKVVSSESRVIFGKLSKSIAISFTQREFDKY